MIHIIEDYPVDSNSFRQTHSGDTVVFLENAILALKKQDQTLSALKQKLLKHINLCVRNGDMIKQGMTRRELLNQVAIIDDPEYTDLMEQNTVIKSWN